MTEEVKKADPLFQYHRNLNGVVSKDVEYVVKKDTQYRSSWKKRGGVGAFFTIVRPWDRLESIAGQSGYDLLGALEKEASSDHLEGVDGTLIACVRDIRRYLLLVEAELHERVQASQVTVVKVEAVTKRFRDGYGDD